MSREALEKIGNREGDCRRSQIIPDLLRRTSGTRQIRAFLIPETRVSNPDQGFEIPSRRENPVVTVSNTAAGQITIVDPPSVTDVVLCSVEVSAKEVTFEGLAQPVAALGLHNPKTEMLPVTYRSGLAGSRNLQSHLAAQGNLDSRIGCQNRPKNSITLYGCLLCPDTRSQQKTPKGHDDEPFACFISLRTDHFSGRLLQYEQLESPDNLQF